MAVREFDEREKALVISGSAAKIAIKKVPIVNPTNRGWFVDWEVVQSKPDDVVVRGRRWLEDDELAAAFGLTDSVGKWGQHILRHFGGDSAEQGKYIRQGDYLNIPCPGTGHDGDPNVSVELDEKMKDAVRKLLAL